MIPSHQPGEKTIRFNWHYSEAQDAKWRVLDDFMTACSFGFAKTRLPTPGTVLSDETVNARMEQVVSRINRERNRMPNVPEMSVDDYPPDLQRFLTERLIPYPSTSPGYRTAVPADAPVYEEYD